MEACGIVVAEECTVELLLPDRLGEAGGHHSVKALRGQKEYLVPRANERIGGEQAFVFGDAVDLEHVGRADRVDHAADDAILENHAELAAGDAAHDAAVRELLEIAEFTPGVHVVVALSPDHWIR